MFEQRSEAHYPRAFGVIQGVCVSTDEQAIRNVVALWHSATAAGDVDPVLGLMAEDMVFLVVGHPPMRGRSSFERGYCARCTPLRGQCGSPLWKRALNFPRATQRLLGYSARCKSLGSSIVTPNPSIERTATGKPMYVVHVKR